MTAPTVYRSDDASAPVLTGVAGSLITVLDAVLVNGYGAKAAAGWTKPYTGANKAAYLMGAGGTSRQMYLRVVDGTTSGRVRGYDGMTDVDTGTEPFPTVAQFASDGPYIMKSSTASAVARPWMILATPKCFYLWTQTTVASDTPWSTGLNAHFFGEYIRYHTHDYNVALIANHVVNATVGATFGCLAHPDGAANMLGHFMCRPHTNIAGSSYFGKAVAQFSRNSTGSPNVMGAGGDLYAGPDAVTGKSYATRVRMLSPGGSPWALNGHLPGLYASMSDGGYGVPHVDTIAGSGSLAGRTLQVMDVTSGGVTAGNTNVLGMVFLDLTDFD